MALQNHEVRSSLGGGSDEAGAVGRARHFCGREDAVAGAQLTSAGHERDPLRLALPRVAWHPGCTATGTFCSSSF